MTELGMPTLEERRERGDLIHVYKVLTGKEMVDHNILFSLCRDRGNSQETRSSTGLFNAERLD